MPTSLSNAPTEVEFGDIALDDSAVDGLEPLAFERRSAKRVLCGGSIWWKALDSDRFAAGWLIERSPIGAAFLTRGRPHVREDAEIQVSAGGLSDVGFGIEEGRVTRIQHVHADLFLVAAKVGTRDNRR